MKIIFVKQNPPYFENLPHRKSYLSVDNGKVIQTKDEIIKNQNNYLNPYFPTKEEIDSMKDNQGYQSLNAMTRIATINVEQDYPEGIYSKDFKFWNNVSYVKIIHSDGFIEYCYILDRKTLNETSNQWSFTFFVDRWNTYWPDVYESIIANKNMPIDIDRWHEDRFDKITFEESDYWVYKFLNTQDTAFWNKEVTEQNFKSNLTIEQGESYTPWTEPKDSSFIELKEDLRNAYTDNLYPGQRFFYGVTGYPYLVKTPKNQEEDKPEYEKLKWFYGLPNNFYILPLINYNILNNANGRINNNYQQFKSYFNDDSYFANRIEWNISDSTEYTASVNFAIKPLLLTNKLKNQSIKKHSYPIRWKYEDNLNLDYVSYSTLIPGIVPRLGSSLTNGNPSDKLKRMEPTLQNKNSKLNTLCDERIDLKNYLSNLYINPINYTIIQEKDINLEPKIYDEELTNIEYSHPYGDSLIISPKWYYYQNWEDLIKNQSLFLMGYQFLQVHATYLLQWPVSGLYQQYNEETLKSSLKSLFAPQLQFPNSTLQSFIANNQSQMNATLNAKLNSMLGNIGLGAAGGAISGGKSGGMQGSIAGSIIGAVGTGIKGAIDYANTKMMQQAKLQDLANAHAEVSDNTTESTLKMLLTTKGLYKINTISDIDKQNLWTIHSQTGYVLNKQVLINPTQPTNLSITSLASRFYYNFWQLNNLKLIIQELNILDEYKEYFESIFSQGITLWHNFKYTDVNGKVFQQHKVGDYSNENWEINLFNTLKPIDIDSLINDAIKKAYLQLTLDFQSATVENLYKLITPEWIKNALPPNLQESFDITKFKLNKVTKLNSETEITNNDINKINTYQLNLNYNYTERFINQNASFFLNTISIVINEINSIEFKIQIPKGTTVNQVKTMINNDYIKSYLTPESQVIFEQWQLTNIFQSDGSPLTDESIAEYGTYNEIINYQYWTYENNKTQLIIEVIPSKQDMLSQLNNILQSHQDNNYIIETPITHTNNWENITKYYIDIFKKELSEPYKKYFQEEKVKIKYWKESNQETENTDAQLWDCTGDKVSTWPRLYYDGANRLTNITYISVVLAAETIKAYISGFNIGTIYVRNYTPNQIFNGAIKDRIAQGITNKKFIISYNKNNLIPNKNNVTAFHNAAIICQEEKLPWDAVLNPGGRDCGGFHYKDVYILDMIGNKSSNWNLSFSWTGQGFIATQPLEENDE